MTIKIVEYWLDKQYNETLCAVIDHLETQSELDSITDEERDQLVEIMEPYGWSAHEVRNKKFFAKRVAPYWMIGRDLDDGYICAISAIDYKASQIATPDEVASL